MEPVYINPLVTRSQLLSDIILLCLKVESFKGMFNVHFEFKPSSFYIAIYDKTKTNYGESIIFSQLVIKDSNSELAELRDIIINLNNVLCYLSDYYRSLLVNYDKADVAARLEDVADKNEEAV